MNRRMAQKAIVRGIALACGVALAAPSLALAQAGGGGTLRTFDSTFRSLNPAVQSGAATGVPGVQLFAGLVILDKNFKPQSYLATKWQISPDGLTYTFHLVPDAIFHDGKPITSEDVAFSLDIVKNNHPFGPTMFDTVTKVDTPDAHTIVIHVNKPTPGLMMSLCPLLMPVLPKHVYGDGQNIKTHPRNMQDVVGSGPFVLTENKPGERLILSRFDRFFVKDAPRLDRIAFQIVPDPLTRILMLEKGDMDYAAFADVRPSDAKRIAANKSLHLTTDGYSGIGFVDYLEVNLRKKPFDDVRVRKALAHAIDSGFIAKVLFAGQVKPGTGPLHSGHPFYTADVSHYKADLAKAAALLDEAGYKKGADGVRFSFVLDVPDWAISTFGPEADYIQPQLAKLGIKVEQRRSPDFATWAKRVAGWDYDATLNGSFNYPDPTIGVHRHFMCANIRNVIWSNTQAYCSKDVDDILQNATVEMDVAKRKALYADLQKKVTEDVAFIYMPEHFVSTIYRDGVKNMPDGAMGAISPWLRMEVGPRQ